ncbi:hypothetical protein F511_26640 [Dorcoceras hygrometricum]|uniref:Dystroglycan-like n=1 Tax=Dorcoceras hygrometricum TaxID=472368 RepID=A0A2Z7D6V0_9LAMI|nr:hypothetical protein F511_26640 [Dorcoceras hygrometricum]
MLITTNWFLQALSVIPRGSWGDVARRSYHDPMGKSGICRLIGGRSFPVVDLIEDLPPPTMKSQSPCDSGWSQAPVASKVVSCCLNQLQSLAIFRLLTMAFSYYTNTLHVNFESIVAMDDPGMVYMFQALMASGLEGFLGCPAVIYEAALVEFFENASVRDGVVVSTVHGVTMEISEQLFAETFELPLEGLSDLSDIPKDLVFDTRSIVSLSGEPVSTSGKKKEMKIEFRLLCDILAKTISVKAGSFDALTMEKFLMLTAIICEVKINWNRVLLEYLIYTSCTDPIPQPATARTPRLHQPSAVTHLFYAYVRKATNTEFNVVVLGGDLILYWV